MRNQWVMVSFICKRTRTTYRRRLFLNKDVKCPIMRLMFHNLEPQVSSPNMSANQRVVYEVEVLFIRYLTVVSCLASLSSYSVPGTPTWEETK